MQKLKRCYKCKKSKPLAYFGTNSVRKDGLQSSCKACQSETNKKYYKNNKKKCINQIMINKRRRALENYVKLLIGYLSNPCVDCGKVYHPSAMVFDHVNGKDKKIYKSEGVMYLVRNGYSWKVIKKEISKCKTRCQNCHFTKTSKQFKHWSEISDLIDDHSSLIKKLYKYNGNFLESSAFNKQKKEISDKFSEFMLEQVRKVTKERRIKKNDKKTR